MTALLGVSQHERGVKSDWNADRATVLQVERQTLVVNVHGRYIRRRSVIPFHSSHFLISRAFVLFPIFGVEDFFHLS